MMKNIKYKLIWPNPCFLTELKAVEVIRPVEAIEFVENFKNDDNTVIVILCEVNEDEKGNPLKRQNLYGIQLAQKLRLYGVKAPIVFISFLTRKYVSGNKHGAIINTIGHEFIQLPITNKDIETIAKTVEPLNSLELEDIQKNYCSLGGTARMLLHSLAGLNDGDLNNDTFKKIRDTVDRLHILFDQNPSTVLSKFDSKFHYYSETKIGDAIDFASDVGNQLLEIHAPSEAVENKLKAINKWKVLFLDDEIGADHFLIQELQKRGIEVLCAQSAYDAEKLLVKDFKTDNMIMVIIADYRLEYLDKEGIARHQPVQGYQFLRDVSMKERYISLVAFSALPRRFLMNSFKHYGVRVNVFSKKDYLEHSHNNETIHMFCDEIVQIGEENFEAVIRLPRINSGKKWELYEPFYIAHRTSIKYIEEESYVVQRAKAYCDMVMNGVIQEKLTGISTELKGKNKVPGKAKAFEDFKNKLIARRVAVWYSQYNPLASATDVLMILEGYLDKDKYCEVKKKEKKAFYLNKHRNLTNFDFELALQRDAKFKINTVLALSLSDFPWNMTIEEKHWMIYEMGFTGIESLEENEDAVLKFAFEKITKWADGYQKFKSLVEETKPNTFRSIKIVLYEVSKQIHKKRDALDSFLKFVTVLNNKTTSIIGPTGNTTDSLRIFSKYLDVLAGKLRRIKSIPLKQSKDKEISVELEKRITNTASKKVKSDEVHALESEAFLFFAELRKNNTSYSSDEEYLKALLKKFNNSEKLNPYKEVEFKDNLNIDKPMNQNPDEFYEGFE